MRKFLCFIALFYIFFPFLFYFRVLCRIYSIPENRQVFLLNFYRRKVFQVPFMFDCIAKRFYYFLIMLTAKIIFSACCLQNGKCVVWALWFKHNPANCSFGVGLEEVNSRLKCSGGRWMRISLIVHMKTQVIPFLYIFNYTGPNCRLNLLFLPFNFWS